MDEVVLCAKDRVGLDNSLTQDTLFLFGFYYVKKRTVLFVRDKFRDLIFQSKVQFSKFYNFHTCNEKILFFLPYKT